MILAQILLTGAAFTLALLYFGFGATRWLLPPAFAEWRVLVMPFVGLALVVVWDYLALYLSFNLTTATIALLAAATLANGAALLRLQPRTARKGFWGRGNPAWSDRARAQFAVALVAFLVFIAAIAPLVRYGYITIIGENWDYEFYLPLADLLRTLPTSALAQAPANPLLNIILSRHILPLPMGFSYLQSSLDVLFRLDALDSFAILLAVVRALAVISPFIFFRAAFRLSPRAALLAASLLAFNGLLLWTTFLNFGLHLTSLALLPVALVLGARLLLARDGRALPLAGLCLAALNVTFHPTLVVALLVLGALGLYALITGPGRARLLALGAALLALTLGLSFPTLFHVSDFLREYYGRTVLAMGLRAFVPVGDAYGVSLYALQLVVGHTVPTPWLYALAARAWDFVASLCLLLALAASALALWRMRRDPARRAVWYPVVAASALYVAIFRVPFLRPYPYAFFKSLTLVSFVLIALAAEGARRGAWSPPRRIIPLLILPFALLTLGTFGLTLEQYFKPAPPFFNADDLRVRQVAAILPPGATVFLTDRPEAQTIPLGLAAYALRAFPLRGNVATGYGALDNAAPGAVYDYALLARGEDPGARGYAPTPLWANDRFALYAGQPGVAYHFNFGGGAQSAAGGMPSITGGSLAFILGAQQVVTGTAAVSPQNASRGVGIALAGFVTQTVTIALGGDSQAVTLAPGLAAFDIPHAQLPAGLTIRSASGAALFVPWIELRTAGTGGPRLAPTSALLVRCASGNAADLSEACAVANPAAVTLRWEYVVRGTLKGSHQDQEFVRRAAVGSPRQSVAIGGDGSLRFDDLPPVTFAPQKLGEGNYRAALEIFAGPASGILLARLDLYQFAVVGDSLRRAAPPDPSLVIVQP